MPTSIKVHEPLIPQAPTRGLAEDRTSAALGLLAAGGLILLVVGILYLDSLVFPAAVQDLGQLVGL